MKQTTPAFTLVITGAPASGKSICLERLKSHTAFAGFIFFDELARRLLEENPDFRHHWHQFHREIYRRQIQREDSVAGSPFVTDRGTADAFAFHPETAEAVGTTIEVEYRRYSAVIQLGSSASLGEKYYAQDDIRNESLADTLAIEAAISKVWRGHPGYHFLPAKKNLETKIRKFIALAVGLIGNRDTEA
ncbi:MAG: ATP-binding protein [candidate division Zixibacteria bacterium]|nr:ATP-binding protein [candidate division Zixibacteria bacterium]